jgi:hypothetical protein
MCEAPNRFYFSLFGKKFTRHVLTLIWVEGTMFENTVTAIFNCYDVVSPSPGCCKSNISECYLVEEFIRI